MTAEQKQKFKEFLWEETPLDELQDMEAICDYVEQNISSNSEGWDEITNEFVAFALQTFAAANPLSSLKKLDEEIKEVAHEINHGHENLSEEYADCLMCIFDSAARMNIWPDQLKKAFAEKLKINKARSWVKNSDNTYSHLPSPPIEQ